MIEIKITRSHYSYGHRGWEVMNENIPENIEELLIERIYDEVKNHRNFKKKELEFLKNEINLIDDVITNAFIKQQRKDKILNINK